MADFITFAEGDDAVLNGLPGSTASFDLSTKSVDELTAETTHAGGYGVATGTGYEAQTEEEVPEAANGAIQLAKQTWETGEATDWPEAVKSCVMSVGSKLICAWNLREGGAARAMNAANTTESFTPTLRARASA